MAPSVAELQLLHQLDAPLKHLPQLAHDFESTFHTLALTSSTQFLPTPVRALPTGSEAGHFLALDLGGTNLRVALIDLLGASQLRIHTQGSWSVPEALKSSTAESLFHWVSSRILDVLRRRRPDQAQTRTPVEMGITFSFPMEQRTHTSALLMPMGKGFTFTHTNDLAALLTAAYAHASTPTDPPLEIVSITNDSVATLLATAYTHPATARSRPAAGIIAGTGTNATCICPLRKLSPSKQPPPTTDDGGGGGAILLNTEWSINGTAPPLAPYITPWDRALDMRNEKPGFQPLEEMVGGRYLGELVRLVCLDAIPSSLPEGMYADYGVDTKLCGDVEAARTDAEVLALLQDYFCSPSAWDVETAAVFKRVCGRVSTRAAALAAAATVGVLGMNGELEEDGVDVVVGYTGTILERYPGFRERCEGFMQEIVGKRKGSDGVTVKLVEALDGGILGAAVLAAMVKGGRT